MLTSLDRRISTVTPSRFRKNFTRSIFLILLIRATAATAESDQAVPGQEKWPVTVEQAVDDILPRLSLPQRLEIKRTKKENLVSLHFGLGLSIRNRYGLWSGNDKLVLSACGFRCHPDAASMKIIEAVWSAVQK
jgi:hypothetical protein